MCCRLCKKDKADQTGAHIFNFALIREIYNPKDNKNRGKEIVYGVSTDEFLEVFFGNSVQPEDIQALKGRDLTDEEIAKNYNPFTVDNIWCRKCEAKFKILEDYFMDGLYLKLRNGEQYRPFNTDITRLYIYSLYWRASVTKYCNFELSFAEEEKLRSLIVKNVGSTLKETETLSNNNSIHIRKIPLILQYHSPQNDVSEHVVLADLAKNPYLLIVNNLYCQIFFKRKKLQCQKRPYFGLNDFYEFKETINQNEIDFNIVTISKTQSKVVLYRIYSLIAKQKARDFARIFTATFVKNYGYLPSEEVSLEFLKRVSSENDLLAYRFSFEHFVQEIYNFFANPNGGPV